MTDHHTQDSVDDTNDIDPGMGTFAVICILIIGFVGLAWWGIPQIYPQSEEAGQFGDMFGGVNALFSGLAFAGVITAILLQKRELRLQRKELEETRKELQGQREQMEMQSQTFTQQSFDSTFFQMLSLHNDSSCPISAQRRTDPGVEEVREPDGGCRGADEIALEAARSVNRRGGAAGDPGSTARPV